VIGQWLVLKHSVASLLCQEVIGEGAGREGTYLPAVVVDVVKLACYEEEEHVLQLTDVAVGSLFLVLQPQYTSDTPYCVHQTPSYAHIRHPILCA
jgi:hypothetical protein